MSVEALVSEINKAGWLITEVYQRHEAEWFAVLRRSGDFSAAHGEGPTMVTALDAAWLIARDHKRMTNADWQAVSSNPVKRNLREPLQKIAAEIKRRESIPRIKP